MALSEEKSNKWRVESTSPFEAPAARGHNKQPQTQRFQASKGISNFCVNLLNSFSKFNGCFPTHVLDSTHIQQFTGCSIGFCNIPFQVPLESDNITDHFSQFLDAEICSGSNVDPFLAIMMPHEMEASRCQRCSRLWIVAPGEVTASPHG